MNIDNNRPISSAIDARMDMNDDMKLMLQERTAVEAKKNRAGTKITFLIPPPNVTGSLHLGHAFVYSTIDAFSRYNARRGRNVLTQMGFDHAGIATQMLINRKYGEHINSYEEAMNHAEEWVSESRSAITNQIKELNLLIDWSRACFTLDEARSTAVKKAFIELYRAGLIYKGQRIVNWDIKLKTAISDLEVYNKEEKQDMVYIQYKGQGFSITVATTRPETIFADVALAVNPTDIRYASFLGKQVTIPLTDRQIPVIPSTKVDSTFGTGVLKLTPAHSFLDAEIGRLNRLPIINIIDEDGLLTGEYVPDRFQGLSTTEARERVKSEVALRTEEVISKRPYGDRSHSLIEPRITEQWFFDCKELGKEATKHVKSGETQIQPEFLKTEYFNWNNNLEDWCISRQIWWGHPIPVWYDPQGNQYCADSLEEAQVQAKEKTGQDQTLTQEKSVLDTWFSSALYHLSSLGWPGEIYEDRSPIDLVVTGYDILGFWVNRMMIMSHFFQKKPAFKNIVLTRLVRDIQGRKMSKTLGNGLDPLELSKEHGVDALRCALIFEPSVFHDIKMSEQKIISMKRFITKIWNSARYILLFAKDAKVKSASCGNDFFSHYIVSSIQELETKYNEYMENFNGTEAFTLVYQYIWDKFCRWFIEIHKITKTPEYSNVLLWAFGKLLILLHPFAPYITELLWQKLEFSQESILSSEYPESLHFNERIVDKINNLLSLTSKVRRIKRILDLEHYEITISTDNHDMKELLKKNKELFKTLVGATYGDVNLGTGITIETTGVSWKLNANILNSDYLELRRITLNSLYIEKKRFSLEEANRIAAELRQVEEIMKTGKFGGQ